MNVTGACQAAADCDDTFLCLGGFCLPGANETGGLGATCTANSECITVESRFGVEYDANGDLYLLDSLNSRVLKVVSE